MGRGLREREREREKDRERERVCVLERERDRDADIGTKRHTHHSAVFKHFNMIITKITKSVFQIFG